LLTILVRMLGATRAVEVGTFTGYGAIRIARGLAPGGTLTCLEGSPEYAEIARQNIERAVLGDRVSILVGPALESIAQLPAEIDFAYVDADKTAYPDYYD